MLPERPYDHFHSWSIVSCTTENAQTSRGWEENISHSRAPSSGRREAGPRPLGIWMVCFKSCNFGRNLLRGFPKYIPDNRILSSDAFETCWVNICGKHSFILGYHKPYLCQGTLGISEGRRGVSHLNLIKQTFYLQILPNFSESTGISYNNVAELLI